MSKTTTTPLRDRFVHTFSNWVINTFASEDYKQKLEYTYQLGVTELETRLAASKGGLK